jgi:hypothetical protein
MLYGNESSEKSNFCWVDIFAACKRTRWAKGFFSFLFDEDNCMRISGRGSIDRYTPYC